MDKVWIVYEKTTVILNRKSILKTMKKRICIYPQDVQLITGKSDRYGRKIIKNKQKHQPVSIDEFCEYMGLKKEEVIPLIL